MIHGHRGDRHGDIQVIGATSVIEEQARAGKTVLATVETIVDSDVLRDDPSLTVVPGVLVSKIAEVPYGVHPTGMYRLYDADYSHIAEYVDASRDPGTVLELSWRRSRRAVTAPISSDSGSRACSRCGWIRTSVTTSNGKGDRWKA